MGEYYVKLTRINLTILVSVLLYTIGSVYWLTNMKADIQNRLAVLENIEQSRATHEERLIRLEERLNVVIEKLESVSEKKSNRAR